MITTLVIAGRQQDLEKPARGVFVLIHTYGSILVPRLGFLLGYSVPEFRRFDVTRRYI